jgi:hypothetical protein
MGEGSSLALINGTNYVWKRTRQWQYQMECWDFPEEIRPGIPQHGIVDK